MNNNNSKIKKILIENKIFQYQIAEKLGISEFTFIRKLRKELSNNEIILILSIIENLKKEKEQANGKQNNI